MARLDAAFRILASIVLLWFVMSLTYPFGWDQGIFAWAGDVIVRGGMPYRDAWDIKGPLAHYVFAATQLLLGRTLWGIRVVDGALLVWAAWHVGGLASRLSGRTAGRWSALVFFLWYASHSFWHTAQPDGWVAALIAAAVLPILAKQEDVSLRRVAVTGLLIGLTALVKPIYVVFLLLPLLYLISSPPPRRAIAVVTLVAAWLVPVIACAFWFNVNGALDELIDVYITYSRDAYAGVGSVAVSERLNGLATYTFEAPAMVFATTGMIAGAAVLWRKDRRSASVLIAWGVLSVSIVLVQGRFFQYHWLPLLPPAVVLGAVAAHSVMRRARSIGIALLTGAILVLLAPIVWEQVRFAAWISGRIDTSAYYHAYGEPGSDMLAVKWLRENGREGKVYVFGWNSSVSYLAGRETVSRFGYSMPLMMGDERGIRAGYRNELMTALQSNPPEYILIGTQADQILGRATSISDFEALAALVADRYRHVATFGPVMIHESLDRPLPGR